MFRCLSLFTVIVLLSLTASSVSVVASSVTHSYGNQLAWLRETRAPITTPIHLVFAINLKNLHLLTELVDTISNPTSPQYGQHLTLDQIHELTSQPELANIVMKYITTQVNPLYMTNTRGSGFVKVILTVGDAEKLLNTHYFTFSSKINSTIKIIRATHYTVPLPIAEHVQFIGYVSHFPSTTNQKLRTSTIPRPDFVGKRDASNDTVPATLNRVYNIDSNIVTNAKSTSGVFETGQYFDPNDLFAFQSKYNLPNQTVTTVVGTNDPTQCVDENQCSEASLDLEYLIAIAQGGPTTFYSVDPNDAEPFLDWLIELDQDPAAPWVNSISYGEGEHFVPNATLARFEIEAQKLGVRGITVMVSSGDDGIADRPSPWSKSTCAFSPSYPASSAYVTAVGATQGPESGQPEVAESSATGGLITTGGGFSIAFPTPSWQTADVAAFLANNATGAVPPIGLYASAGRGYPDVALLGHNYEVLVGGQVIVGSGTSASSPVFAGMITLINSARFDLGKGPLGFLNPALYQLAASPQGASIFHDITSGENNCDSGSPSPNCCPYGFTATAGWDPVTGLGSVNFVNLKKALAALP